MKKYIFWLCIIFNSALAQPNITWHKFFDTYQSNTGSYSIVELPDSSYTLLAKYNGKQMLIHLNMYGDTVWTKTYKTNLSLRSFIKSSDGGYAMLGFINDWSLVKTDSMGDTLWTKPFPQLSDPRCVIQTSDGGYAISSYNGGWDMIKTDASGGFKWQASTGGGIHVQGIIECFNKQFLVFGNSGFNPFCYKAGLLDSLGNVVWVNYYGNVTFLGADIESILSAVQLPDSNFIFGCSIDTTVEGQYHLVKVNYSNGNLIDSIKYNDMGAFEFCKLSLLNDGNLILYSMIYFRKIDSTFGTIWFKTMPFGIASCEQTYDNGFIGLAWSSLVNPPLARIEYAKLDSLGNIFNFQGIPSINVNELRVYPNPAFNQLAISSQQLANGQEVTVTIYDMLGKVQLQQTIVPHGDFNVDVKVLSSGIYMLQLKQEDRLFTGRFVKE
jgi:hypothetical protein